jgi:hypothetical protein
VCGSSEPDVIEAAELLSELFLRPANLGRRHIVRLKKCLVEVVSVDGSVAVGCALFVVTGAADAEFYERRRLAPSDVRTSLHSFSP